MIDVIRRAIRRALDRRHQRDSTDPAADDNRLRQFAVAVFVSPRADNLLGVLLALDINEAGAIQQAFDFARSAWGCDPADLHYVAAEHGALWLAPRSGR